MVSSACNGLVWACCYCWLTVWVFCLQALVSLCSDDSVSAKSALDLCVKQMKNVLSSQQLPENASMEIIGRAYHATETLVQVILPESIYNMVKIP